MNNDTGIKVGNFNKDKTVSIDLNKDELYILSACLDGQHKRMLTPKGAIKKKYNKFTVSTIERLSHIFLHLACMLEGEEV